MKINVADLALFLSEIELPEGVISISKTNLDIVPSIHLREQAFHEQFKDIDYHRMEYLASSDKLWVMVGNVEVFTLEETGEV